MPTGRPSSFTEVMADSICIRIAEGDNLHRMCTADEGFPLLQTVYNWFKQQPQFFENYTRARELRASARAARIDDYCMKVLAGQLDPNAARVIIDAEKWQAGKENPKVYGDRIENRLADPNGNALKIVVTGIPPTEENT